jgi:hypothetical protein
MPEGKVTKLVKGYGSTWGRVRANGQAKDPLSKDVFFNVASLTDPEDFLRLSEGSAVLFEVQPERANGVIAIGMSMRPLRKRRAKASPLLITSLPLLEAGT